MNSKKGRFTSSMLPKLVEKYVTVGGHCITIGYCPGEPIISMSCKGHFIAGRINGRKTDKQLRKQAELMVFCLND